MGTYLSKEAITWARMQLEKLSKDQIALLYFLIFARCPKVDRTIPAKREKFESEFYKYFGVPIKGGGVASFNPFDGKWRAPNYINSTVYGRLLVGSHRWTEGSEAFFTRTPSSSGWPAEFSLTDEGFDNLLYRNQPPLPT